MRTRLAALLASAFLFLALAGIVLRIEAHGLPDDDDDDNASAAKPADLPTGMRITPTAAPALASRRSIRICPGARFQGRSSGDHGRSAPTASTLLILTSGYNVVTTRAATSIPQESTNTSSFTTFRGPPKKLQVCRCRARLMDSAWNPNGSEFYVSGGSRIPCTFRARRRRGRCGDLAGSGGRPPRALGGPGHVPPARSGGHRANAAGTRLLPQITKTIRSAWWTWDLARRWPNSI